MPSSDGLGILAYIKNICHKDYMLLLEEIREAAEEMKLIQEGKKQGRNAEDFLRLPDFKAVR